MKAHAHKRPHGQLRQSQLVLQFGPGALVDLPEHSVMVSGLDDWADGGREIFEDRLVAKIVEQLGKPGIRLKAPPLDHRDPSLPPTGITAWTFPEWFVAQYKKEWTGGGRARPLVHRGRLERGRKFIAPDRKPVPAVPVRFVQACIHGHISDIRWWDYVHRGPAECRAQLWLVERGTGGDLADVFVHCDCGKARPLLEASRVDDMALGYCDGLRPWLGGKANEKCGGNEGKRQPNRLLIRTASDAYFAQVLSVISIPDPAEEVRKAVAPVWTDYLQYVKTLADLKREMIKSKVSAALEACDLEEVLAEIGRRKGTVPADTRKIKQVEIEALSASPNELGQDIPEGDFHARAIPTPGDAAGGMAAIERVVLVHRLREVLAQVGFTRFEPAVPDVQGELSLNVQRADLARELSWVPAVENRGEGIFLSFRRAAIESWLKRDAVVQRGTALMKGFDAWMKAHPGSKATFAGLPYMLLHSLSHLLITAVSLECGYAATSIRERIYAGDAGYGILLYTGTADAEGTLGGLVQVGRRIDVHLRHALELGRLCSNDPICAQHDPTGRMEERYLHGAACHGCLLIAETSCERRNELLDRALVVDTVDGAGEAFFGGECE